MSDGAVIGQYVYDALNRRIRKTVSNGGLSGTIPNGTTDCIYSGWRCVEERNPFGGGGSTDTPTAQYIWGIYLDECLQQRLLVGAEQLRRQQRPVPAARPALPDYRPGRLVGRGRAKPTTATPTAIR